MSEKDDLHSAKVNSLQPAKGDPLHIEPADYNIFDQVRGPRSLTSNVRVEELLMNDKDLLALFFVVTTWNEVSWYEFENINDIVPYTTEYWHQLDMNRVAHTYWGLDDLKVARVGSHCGDCISVACTCERCMYESEYIITQRIKNIMTSELSIAMLLARDRIRMEQKEAITKEIDAETERMKGTGGDATWKAICYVYDKYPSREYSIDLEKHISHWATLSDEEKQPYLIRAKQIRAWCDKRPECPGVPW